MTPDERATAHALLTTAALSAAVLIAAVAALIATCGWLRSTR